MPITADYHMHSLHSGDSQAPMEQMIQSAISKGLTHICFTEHMDFDFPVSEFAPEGHFEVNTDSYLYDLVTLKNKYASQIQVNFGIELGLQPHLARQLAVYAKSFDFDFIIGSSHIVNKTDPYLSSYYEGRSEEEAYREYFSSIIENLRKISNFDVYGHLDYVVRYGPNRDTNYSYDKYKDIYDELLTLLLEKEKGIELNTSALRSGLRDMHPCMDVLRRYRELGGEIITIGSDAHKPEHVGSDLQRAAEVLTECGFKYYTVFQHRLPEFKRI